MIRQAIAEDVPQVVAMGSRSLAEGPYRDELDNPEQSATLAFNVIQQPNGRLFVAEENGRLVGLLGFIVYPHYFTGQLTAIELMWYVQPEHRQSFTGIALVRCAEAEARAMGAVKMQMTAPTPEVGRAYELMGYKPLETAHQKTL